VDALNGASALVVATEWPEYRSVGADEILRAMATPIVLDAGSFLRKALGDDPRIRYVTVGRAQA
jgi:UDPglucose 6-dehydrogenase